MLDARNQSNQQNSIEKVETKRERNSARGRETPLDSYAFGINRFIDERYDDSQRRLSRRIGGGRIRANERTLFPLAPRRTRIRMIGVFIAVRGTMCG
jgi:hypothetical protein